MLSITDNRFSSVFGAHCRPRISLDFRFKWPNIARATASFQN